MPHHHRRLPLIILAAAVLSGAAGAAEPVLDIDAFPAAADDWWLPDWVQPLPGTGFYDHIHPSLPAPDALLVETTWRELEPQPGVFRVDRLRAKLAAGPPVWLRLLGSDVRHCPDWLPAQHPDLRPMRFLSGRDAEYGDAEFYPIWHPGFLAAWGRLVDALAAAGLPGDERLRFAYAPFAWRWNEFELHFLPQMQRDGLAPEDFLRRMTGHLRHLATAFGPHAGKLVYTGPGMIDWARMDHDWAAILPGADHLRLRAQWITALNDLPSGRNLLTDAAVAAGCGVRVGALEGYNRYNHLASWGAPAIREGAFRRQVLVEDHPLRAPLPRIVGTENEAFGEAGMMPGMQLPFFQRQLTLKSLLIGATWINPSRTAYDLHPAIHDYARRVLGRTISTTPDAWCALRQWSDPDFAMAAPTGLPGPDAFLAEQQVPLRTWSRWLRLVGGPGAEPRPTCATELPRRLARWRDDMRAHEAMRTDAASGNTVLRFDLDDRFPHQAGTPLRIFATVLDRPGSALSVQVGDRPALPLPGRGDGRWRTLSVTVPAVTLAPGDHDLDLRSTGTVDAVVTLVRIVRDEQIGP